MKIIRSLSELREYLEAYRKNDVSIGFVPTMGALHDGHLSLVDIAKENADRVVVSIFVNPAQFSINEDLDKYPRNEEDDLKKLKGRADVVYLPSVEDIYPEGFDIKISTGAIGLEMEGVERPHFFDGVALVVTKLFMQVQPNLAVFGEKDFQQLHIIKKLVKGFDIPIKIIGGAIIREKNGLAMSSRNAYLSHEQKQKATNLQKIMHEVAKKIKADEEIEDSLSWGVEQLKKSGFDKVSYLEVRSSDSLQKTTKNQGKLRLIAAVYLNGIRLLDNIEI